MRVYKEKAMNKLVIKPFGKIFSIYLLLVSCSVHPSFEEERVEFPEQTDFIGTAQGTVDGLTIKGSFDFVIRKTGEDRVNNIVYASIGGGAYRSVRDAQGNGVSFWADAYSYVIIEFPTPKKIIIYSRDFEPTGESRFWDELLRFEGFLTEEGKWIGIWKCSPFDTRGDTVGTVKGAWIIEN